MTHLLALPLVLALASATPGSSAPLTPPAADPIDALVGPPSSRFT